jgi:protocatechuate 3,4-dioxygenase beta subunit
VSAVRSIAALLVSALLGGLLAVGPTAPASAAPASAAPASAAPASAAPANAAPASAATSLSDQWVTSVSGTVTGADGIPLAGTQVYVYYRGGSYAAFAQTDAQGRYTVAGLEASTFKLRFMPVGDAYVGEWWNDKSTQDSANLLVVGQYEKVTGVDAILALGSTVSGRVTGDGTGAALLDATVNLIGMDEQSGGVQKYAYTDADGNYAFHGLPGGQYTLQVTPAGGNFLREWWKDQPTERTATRFTVGVSTAVGGMDVSLPRGASISGTVAADAAPSVGLANMSVWVYNDDQNHVAATQTDAQGNYTIDALEPDTYRLLFRPYDEDYRFTPEWYDDQASFDTSDPIELDAAETVTGINALLGGSATITGTVTAEGGAAIERVNVTAYTKNGASPAYAVTDENGKYTIPGLRPGAYTLQFEDYSWSGFASEWWNNQAAEASAEYFSVPAGGTVTKDAALAQGGAITGTVLLEGGGEQWSFEVNAYADGKLVKSGYTDSQGTLHLDNLSAGTYTLEFTGGQGLTVWWKDQSGPESATTITVVSGETVNDINLEVPRAATISGTVTTPGSPSGWLGYDRVRVFAYSTAEPSVLVSTTDSDRQGEYTIRGLRAGSYNLQFVAEGRNYAAEWWNDQPTQEASTPITVGKGEAVTGMDAVLDAGASISGNVKGAGAASLSTLIVKALPLGASAAPESLSTLTDEDGNYTISGLPAGEYSLQFIPNIGHNYVGEYWNDKTLKADATYFSVAAEQEVTGKDAVLAPGASLSGSVLGELPAGVTTDDVLVEAFAKNGDSAGRTTADISGRYSLRALRAGTYTVKFSVDTGATKMLEWWNDQPTKDTAVPVTLTAGQKQTGLNVDFASNALSATPKPTITGTAQVGKTLTATAGTWKPAPVTLAYQWFRAGTEIPGATAATYLLTADDAGAAITVAVTGTKSGYITASKTSDSVTVDRSFTTTPPTITGTTTVGQKLTATPGSWTPTPSALSYQWLRGTTFITGATASTYTLVADDAGKAITVTVTGKKTGYTTVTTTSTATAAIAKPLTATPTPTITGAVKVGQTLTATPGTWKPTTVTFKYQWLRAGTAIAGATASTYKLVTADAGAKISATVTGSQAGYATATKTSTATAMVTGGVLTAPGVPTVSGTTTVGQTLSAKPGTWAPATVTLTYQWLRAGTAISGATASTYKLAAADAGKAITVKVTGSKVGFTTVAKTSTATTAIVNVLTATPTPTISGTVKVGQTLTAKAGTWSPATVTLKYQWLRGTTAIAGATAATYKPVPADAGAKLTVAVTGSKAGFVPVTKTSTATAIVTGGVLTATPVPTIGGTTTVGQTLTAKAGTWAPATVTLGYQWLRAGTAISGATASTYTLVAADGGKAITVKVTGTKSGFTTVAKTSTPTAAIASLLTATPTPTIAGTVKVGQPLTAKPGTWTPVTVTLKYQWFRAGTAIAGATASTYKPVAADAAATLTVKVTGSKAGYVTVAKTSAATVTVVK